MNELLGEEKQPETISRLVQSISLLRVNFGRIDIRLGNPFSLQQFVRLNAKDRGLDPFSNPFAMRTMVNIVSYRVMYETNRISVAMPISLVVTVLLTHAGRGIGRK